MSSFLTRHLLGMTVLSSPEPDSDKADQATSGFDGSQWLPALVIIGAAVAIGLILRYGGERLLRKNNEILARLFGRALLTIAVAVGIVYSLSTLGIDVGLLVGALGVGGFAVAFALRDTLENLIAGIILQVRQPFDYDDTVLLDGHLGKVDDINLRSVEMTKFSGEKVIIPSADVLQSSMENWSIHPTRRIDIDFGISYDADIEEARSIVEEALGSVDGVLSDPAADVVFVGFGASSVDLAGRFWYESDDDYFAIQFRAAVAIKRALDDNEIDIPFPTRTVLHTDSDVDSTNPDA